MSKWVTWWICSVKYYTGRKVGTAKDIIPVEAEYYRYKQVKAELEKIQEGNKKRPLHPRAAEAKS